MILLLPSPICGNLKILCLWRSAIACGGGDGGGVPLHQKVSMWGWLAWLGLALCPGTKKIAGFLS
jgi:hypothetical protein